MRPLRGRLLGVRIRVVRHHLFSSIFLEHPHPLLQALQFDLPGRPKQWDQEIAECRIESQWGMNYKGKMEQTCHHPAEESVSHLRGSTAPRPLSET